MHLSEPFWDVSVSDCRVITTLKLSGTELTAAYYSRTYRRQLSASPMGGYSVLKQSG